MSMYNKKQILDLVIFNYSSTVMGGQILEGYRVVEFVIGFGLLGLGVGMHCTVPS